MTYKEKYHAYLKSDKWAQMKLDLIEIRGQKCERCESKRTFKYLHLHHLTYERVFHEEPSDLELLCGGCHVSEHGIEKPKKKAKIKRKKKKTGTWKKIKAEIALKYNGKPVEYYQELMQINHRERNIRVQG